MSETTNVFDEVYHLREDNSQLRADNARLKSEVEAWKRVPLNKELRTELELCHDALEKARVLLPIIECKCDSASFGEYTCPRCEALTTINELLQKGSK